MLVWEKNSIVSQLVGNWQFDRVIIDTKSQSLLAKAMGQVDFTTVGINQLRYFENTLTTSEYHIPIKGTCSYYFYQVKSGLEIYFDDNKERLFHSLKLQKIFEETIEADSVHQCSADIYESHYQFNIDGTFNILHKVRGPQKAYISKTCYYKLISSNKN